MIEWLVHDIKLDVTWYLFLYSLAVDACANNIWWSAMYGSEEELPLVQLIPKGGEHLLGGASPES